MQTSEGDVRQPGESNAEQARLIDAVTSVQEHISALHVAGRQLLRRRAEDGDPLREIRFDVRVNAEGTDSAADAPGPGSECYTASYICGKGPTGYLRCTVEVCIEVEPATVLPG